MVAIFSRWDDSLVLWRLFHGNVAAGTTITVNHAFHDEVAEQGKHVWKCNVHCYLINMELGDGTVRVASTMLWICSSLDERQAAKGRLVVVGA